MAGTQTLAAARPARMSIGNLEDGTSLEVQYNPTELAEELEVLYQRMAVLGLSHQPLQYTGTGNLKITFELAFDALAQTSTPRYEIMEARKYLSSLDYARRGATSVRGGSPPRLLFVWPNLYSLQCRKMSTRFRFTRFALDGSPTAFSCGVVLEEIREMRLHSEDVLAYGTQRSAAPQESA